MTHPDMPNDPKWRLVRYADAQATCQSTVIYLHPSWRYIRVIPTMTDEFRSRKEHHIVLGLNYRRIPPTSTEPLYWDLTLNGVDNDITLDALTSLKAGEKKDYAPPQLQCDFERMQLQIILQDVWA